MTRKEKQEAYSSMNIKTAIAVIMSHESRTIGDTNSITQLKKPEEEHAVCFMFKDRFDMLLFEKAIKYLSELNETELP